MEEVLKPFCTTALHAWDLRIYANLFAPESTPDDMRELGRKRGGWLQALALPAATQMLERYSVRWIFLISVGSEGDV